MTAIKAENISVITPRDRFSWRRTGLMRTMLDDVSKVPVVGPVVDATVGETLLRREPLEVWRQETDRLNVRERMTDIPFGMDNRTMIMTTGLDTMFYLWDRHAWADERRSMAEGLRSGVYDQHGDWSYDTWVRARSSLGPKVLSNLVQGALGPDHKPVPHFSEILNLFERNEDPNLRRREFFTDLAVTLTAALGPGAADFIMLKLMPSTTETVNNPQILTTSLAGGALGAMGGVAFGLALDALPAKDLPKAAKVAIPLASAVLGALGADFATEQIILPGMERTIQVTHIPLNDHGWTIPVVMLAGGAIFGYPRFKKHGQIRNVIANQLESIKGWRNMFAMMANDVNYMRKVQEFMDTHAPDAGRVAAVNNYVYTKFPQLYDLAMKFAHREPDHIAEMQALAGSDLKTLAEQVLFAEMVSFSQGYADRSKGKANPTIQGFIPGAGEYFAALNNEGLAAAGDTCDLVKSLGDKKDYVGALSIISPSLAQIMLTQAQEGNLGAADDTMHFGEAGMNTGTRGVFVHLVAETFNKLLTVPDSKRAELTNQLEKLGALYTKTVPIGGQDRIYTAPSHLRLGALYGYAFLRARPHTLSNPADAASHGDYGSKGLLSDVGKAALGVMKENPLATYMFLADISVAIDHINDLLVNANAGDRHRIRNGLVSLRREIASEVIRERFPHNKATAVKFFTDGQYAFEAYTALTMLEEVCGNDVVQPLIGRQAAVLSPLFTQDDLTDANPVVVRERKAPNVVKFNGIVGDTPNLYSAQLIDFVWNAGRHPASKVHQQLEEFLKRGMLPLLIREYYDRLLPHGRGEVFDEAQLENTVNFAGYALETVDGCDLIPLAMELTKVLNAFDSTAGSSVAPMNTLNRPAEDISRDAQNAYRRGQALVAITNRLLAKRYNELNVPVPVSGSVRTTLNKRLEKLVRSIDEKVTSTIRPQVVVSAPSGKP